MGSHREDVSHHECRAKSDAGVIVCYSQDRRDEDLMAFPLQLLMIVHQLKSFPLISTD